MRLTAVLSRIRRALNSRIAKSRPHRRRRNGAQLSQRLEERLLLAADVHLVSYDITGNVAVVRDALGQETSFEYDDLGRVTTVQGPETKDFANFAYDANSNVVSMHDATGYTFYSYDSFDRLTRVTKSEDATDGNADDVTIGYTYDLAGNIDTLTYPDLDVVDYDYDSANRLTEVTHGSDVTTYEYFADNQLKRTVLPNGIEAAYSYDDAGRLEDLLYENADGELVVSYHYQFDANSNRTSMEVRRPNLDTPETDDFNVGVYGYEYDARDQLIKATYPDGSVVSYTYDGVGNRTSLSTDPDGGGSTPAEVILYEYGIENRLLRITDENGEVLETYEYDGRGNQVARKVAGGVSQVFEYDYRNLLTRVSDGTEVVEFRYDGRGDRVLRTIGNEDTLYINDVSRLNTQVLSVTTSSKASKHVYGATSRIKTSDNDGDQFFVTDALGSTSELLNEIGSVVSSFNYDAFGDVRVAIPSGGSDPTSTTFLFAGEDFEPELGLRYHRARFADPGSGRFINKDPSGFPDGPNRYTFTVNNPVNLVDPSGLYVQVIAAGATALPGAVMTVQTYGPVAINAAQRYGTVAISAAQVYGPAAIQTAQRYGTSALGAIQRAGTSTVNAVQRAGTSTLTAVQRAGTSAANAVQHYGTAAINRGTTYALQFANTAGQHADAVINTLEAGYNNVVNALDGDGSTGQKAIDAARGALEAPIEGVINSHLPPGMSVRDGLNGLFDNNSSNPSGIAAPESGHGGSGTIDYSQLHQAAPDAYEPGGVLFSKAAEYLGDLTELHGVIADSATGQVALLGSDEKFSEPLKAENFVVAVRSVFSTTEPLGVSIDPPTSGDPDDPQSVRFFGGVEDTNLGYVFFEADRVMKSLAAGKDNITKNDVASSVPGYESMASRWADSFDPNDPDQMQDARWFFKIADMELVRSDDGESFVFNKSAIELVAENPDGSPSTDPDAVAFAEWFTTNYDAIAAEAYPHPSLDGLSNPFVQLKQAAQAVSLAQFFVDNNIDVDFSWIDTYEVPFVDTPETTPTVVVENDTAFGTVQFIGGIDLGEPNEYLADSLGSVRDTASDARDSRPDDASLAWMLSDGATEAVALSFESNPEDGNIVLAETDLVARTIGDFSVTSTRYYNSFRPIDGPVGFGWEIAPSRLSFERPILTHTISELKGLREGEVRFEDLQSGRVLSFATSLGIQRYGNGEFAYAGLENGQPVYTASDQFDGSTLQLSEDRETLTLIHPDGASRQYTKDGHLLSHTDRNGNAVDYSYVDDRLTEVRDASGAIFTYTYNADGRISHVVGQGADRVNFSYDDSGNLTSAIRVRGNLSTTYSYDADHRIIESIGQDERSRFHAESDILNRSTSRTDRRGNDTAFDFETDPTSLISTTTVEDVLSGRVSSTTRDTANRPLSVNDPVGRTTSFTYEDGSSASRPTSIQLPDSSRPEIQFSYDGSGNLTSVFDPANDPDGDGYTQRFFYDGNDNLSRYVDAKGIESSFTYDAANNLVTTSRSGSAWTYEYFDNGLLKSVTDPLDHSVSYEYDTRGNLTSVSNEFGSTAYEFDALNRLTKIIDPLTRTYSLQYNDFDQIVEITAPQGTMSRVYDQVTKQLVQTTDFGSNTTDFDYDEETGDLLKTTRGSETVQYEYDRFGNLTALIDANENRTQFLYDELNRSVGSFTSFDGVVASLRSEDAAPWTVIDGTLVIAGSNSALEADSILFDNDNGSLSLVFNLTSYSLDGIKFDGIYVDAGDGDDVVDVRSVPEDVVVTVFGQAGSDVLLTGDGNDVVFGNDGADWIEAGDGNDLIFGGKDADVLFAHTSAVGSLFENENSTSDRVFGESGDDLLFTRMFDVAVDGAGENSWFGKQRDGSFEAWTQRDIPLGLTGRLLLVGDSSANNVSIKVIGDNLFVAIDEKTHLLDLEAFDFVTGLFSQILILTGGEADYLDASESPVPIFFYGGGGNDFAMASEFNDEIVGGSGADDIYAQGGDDRVLDGSGADTVDAGIGDDVVVASDDGAIDEIRGSRGRNVFHPSHNDRVSGTNEQTRIVSAESSLPQNIPDGSWIGTRGDRGLIVRPGRRYAVRRTDSVSQRQRPTRPITNQRPDITSFIVSPDIVEQGESVLLTLFSSAPDEWARFEVSADLNSDGIHETELFTTRGRHLDWRTQISTNRLPIGNFSIIAALKTVDGRTVYSEKQILLVTRPTEEQVPSLPASIEIDDSDTIPIVPFKNGDFTIPENALFGDRLTVWKISSNTSGNFRIRTPGAETVVGWYDAQGNILGHPDDDGDLTQHVDANTTYYFVVGASTENGGAYDMVMTGPNQSTAATIDVPPAQYRGKVNGELTPENRLDFFKVVAPIESNLLSVEIEAESEIDILLRIEDSNNNIIGYVETGAAGSVSLLRNREITGGETYYIAAYSINGAGTEYSLTADFDPDVVGLPETITPPEQFKQLIPLANGDFSIDALEISSAGEFDYFFLTPSATKEFTLRTTGNLDTEMAVYHGSGSLRYAMDDDGGDAFNAQINSVLSERNNLWVVVRAKGDSTGDYSFELVSDSERFSTVPIGGLERRATRVDSVSNSFRTEHFEVTAPEGTSSLTVTSTPVPLTNRMEFDTWIAILSPDGTVVTDNSGGVLSVDQITNHPVIPGETYYVTMYGWGPSVGTTDMEFDFDPNFSGGGEIPVNSTTNGDQTYPSIAMNSTGNSVVVWQSANGTGPLLFQRFDSNGNSVAEETRIDEDDGDYLHVGARAGMASDGSFVVSWLERTETTARDNEHRAMVRLFHPNGTPKSAELAVGYTSLSVGVVPDIAVQDDGSFIVAGGTRQELMIRTFDSNGDATSDIRVIDATQDNKPDGARVAARGDGLYAVAWTASSDDDETVDGYSILVDENANPIETSHYTYRSEEISGRRFDDVNSNGTQDTGEPGLPNVTVFIDGNGNGIRDDGESFTLTDEFGDYTFTNVGPDAVYSVIQETAGPSGPAVWHDDFNRSDSTNLGGLWTEVAGDLRIENQGLRTATNDRSYAILNGFESNAQSVVFDLDYDVSSGERTAIAEAYLAYENDQNYVRLQVIDAFNDDDANFNRVYFESASTRFGNAWARMSGGDWFEDVSPFVTARVLAVYDPASESVTIGIDREFDGTFETLVTRGGVSFPGLGRKIGVGGENNIRIDNLVVNPSVFVERSVALPGKEFVVAPNREGEQRVTDVDINSTGAFAVGFSERDSETDYDVFAQRFDSNATRLEGPLQGNEYVVGRQYTPSVAVKSNGEFVIAWQSENEGDDSREIYFRQFDSAGRPATPDEVMLNTFASGSQEIVDVDTNGLERFGFVWQSAGKDGSGFGIAGMFLDLPTPTPTPVLQITEQSGIRDDLHLEFGEVAVNSSSPSEALQLLNRGTSTLEISLELHGSDVFTVRGGSNISIAPGDSHEVIVDSSSVARGVFSGTLRVESNDEETPIEEIELSIAIVPEADKYEDNETASSAADLGVVSGRREEPNLSIHTSENEDWYRFELLLESEVKIGITHLHEEGDLDAVLFDRFGTAVSASTTTSDNELIVSTLTAGTPYFLRVFSTGANVYDLVIDESPKIPRRPAAEFDSSSVSFDEGSSVFNVELTLTEAAEQIVVVPFTVSGTAVTGPRPDYDVRVLANEWVFQPGETTASIPFLIYNDEIDEIDESLILRLQTPTNATLGDLVDFEMKIVDDDQPPEINFVSNSTRLTEANANVEILVQLDSRSGRDTEVPLTFTGSAERGIDFDANATLVIPAGSLSGTVSIELQDDTDVESIELLDIGLADSDSAVAGNNKSHLIELIDDDSNHDQHFVQFSVSEQNAAEGSNSVQVILTIDAVQSYDVDIPVFYAGSASASDFRGAKDLVTISSGDLSASFALEIVDDLIDETDEFIVLAIGTPSEGENGLRIIHRIIIADNDTAGISLAGVQSPINVIEGGSSGEVQLQLNSTPVHPVSITLTTSPESEISIDGTNYSSSLSIESTDSSAVSLFVRAIDDAIIEGKHFSLIQSKITGSILDRNYDSWVTQPRVVVEIEDNDVADFSLSTTDVTVSEAGSQQSVSLLLTAMPDLDVVLELENPDSSELTLSKSRFTFSSENWNVSQDFIITGVDDDRDDGAQMNGVIVRTIDEESDPSFRRLRQTVVVTTTDDDEAGFSVNRGTVSVSESGTTQSFSVSLTAQPLSDVVITIDSNDEDEAVVSTDTLTFTPSNWNNAQTVTVTGVDDVIVDGDQTTTLTVAIDDSSSDNAFDGLNSQTVVVTTTDDDEAGFSVNRGTVSVSESGTTQSFSVSLTAQPLSDVVITIDSNDEDEAVVSTDTLTFTPSNWNNAQTVTVTGVDDVIVDGDQTTTLTVAIDDSSSDDAFDGLSSQTVEATTTDDDEAGFSVNRGTVSVSESGTTQSFSVSLTAQPLSDVVITIDSNDEDEAVVSTDTLTFTPSNWNNAQTVTVTGVDDVIVDGDQTTTLTVAIDDSSSDDAFDGLNSQTVVVTTTDDDEAGFSVNRGTVSVSESGTTQSFSVSLTAQPLSDVVITIDSNDEDEAVVSTDTLTFTPSNWNNAQAVTVTGVDDVIVDGDQTTTLTVAIDDSSSDDAFDGLNSQTVVVTTTDDDEAGFSVNRGTVSVSESGTTQSFSVSLTAQPLSDVVITIDSNDEDEAVVSTDTLTFTPSNWNNAQTVTVTGVDDVIVDGDQTTTLTVAIDDSSSDNAFDGLNSQTVVVTTTDDDEAGFSVNRGTVSVSESGTTQSFSVSLTAQPLSDVVITIDSNDEDEAVVSTDTLTFTPSNWNNAQAVTVTGVDDVIVDGDQTTTLTVAIDDSSSDDALMDSTRKLLS